MNQEGSTVHTQMYNSSRVRAETLKLSLPEAWWPVTCLASQAEAQNESLSDRHLDSAGPRPLSRPNSFQLPEAKTMAHRSRGFAVAVDQENPGGAASRRVASLQHKTPGRSSRTAPGPADAKRLAQSTAGPPTRVLKSKDQGELPLLTVKVNRGADRHDICSA